MNSAKKRSWFQIHLSTAVVMMLLAGGWIFLNARVKPNLTIEIRQSQLFESEIYELNLEIGWPYCMCSVNHAGGISNIGSGERALQKLKQPITLSEFFGQYSEFFQPEWQTLGILINTAILVFALVFSYLAFEFSISKRDRRPAVPQSSS